jgi:probable rRNA maturation factor
VQALVTNRQRAVPISRTALRRAALVTMRAEQCSPHSEVSIAVVDDAAIRALNRRYRADDRPTDVLAFAQDGVEGLLGDVVISAERAAAQAPRYGHTVERELRLLVIHGVLHLLGYDDATPRAARRMRRRQTQILGALDRGAGSVR